MAINWDTLSGKEERLVNLIVDRAMKLYDACQIEDTKLDCRMDITATHQNGTPLDLQKLLNFDDMNFGYDVLGIRKHLNRHTGELEYNFLPRCSRGK